jgi:hypothetical protein
LFEEGGNVVGFADAFEEGGEDFTLDEAGGADLDGWQEFEELLGGAGLEFEEGFEVAAVVVGAHGAADGAGDFVQAW